MCIRDRLRISPTTFGTTSNLTSYVWYYFESHQLRLILLRISPATFDTTSNLTSYVWYYFESHQLRLILLRVSPTTFDTTLNLTSYVWYYFESHQLRTSVLVAGLTSDEQIKCKSISKILIKCKLCTYKQHWWRFFNRITFSYFWLNQLFVSSIYNCKKYNFVISQFSRCLCWCGTTYQTYHPSTSWTSCKSYHIIHLFTLPSIQGIQQSGVFDLTQHFHSSSYFTWNYNNC